MCRVYAQGPKAPPSRTWPERHRATLNCAVNLASSSYFGGSGDLSCEVFGLAVIEPPELLKLDSSASEIARRAVLIRFVGFAHLTR